MAPTFTKFSEEVFNSVRHIDGLPHDEFKDPSEDFKKLVYAHNLTDVVGITLTHKHMDIRENEVIVGSFDSVNNKVVITYRAITADDGDLTEDWIPFQFVYGANFGWMPVAYWDVRSSGSAVMKAKFDKIKGSTFLSDLSTILQNQETGGIANFGICLLFHSLIEGHETGLVETTDTHERTQWFRVEASLAASQFSKVTTIWHWNPELFEDNCVVGCLTSGGSHTGSYHAHYNGGGWEAI